MSKFTLGQRQFPTLGLRSQQPKNYVGPMLSCYLGLSYLNLTKYHLDTQKVKNVHKLTPKQANIENQIRSTALERSVI